MAGYVLLKSHDPKTPKTKTRKTKGFSFEKNDLFLYENKPDSRDSDKIFHMPHGNKKENKKRIVNDTYIP